MLRKFAVLIDAGFLERKIGSSIKPMAVEQVLEFTNKIKERRELARYTLHRIYYYDAEPMEGKRPIPLTGSSENWSLHDFSTTTVMLFRFDEIVRGQIWLNIVSRNSNIS